MTWTYSPVNMTNRDEVRLLIGDTRDADHQFEDEEIDFLLTIGGGPLETAVLAAEALAAKYAREVDKSVGDLRISASQKRAAYNDRAKTLRSSTTRAIPSYAGRFWSTARDDAANPDLRQKAFSVDMMEPDAGVNYGNWLAEWLGGRGVEGYHG